MNNSVKMKNQVKQTVRPQNIVGSFCVKRNVKAKNRVLENINKYSNVYLV